MLLLLLLACSVVFNSSCLHVSEPGDGGVVWKGLIQCVGLPLSETDGVDFCAGARGKDTTFRMGIGSSPMHRIPSSTCLEDAGIENDMTLIKTQNGRAHPQSPETKSENKSDCGQQIDTHKQHRYRATGKFFSQHQNNKRDLVTCG
jgi:hypothetical protein